MVKHFWTKKSSEKVFFDVVVSINMTHAPALRALPLTQRENFDCKLDSIGLFYIDGNDAFPAGCDVNFSIDKLRF